MLSAYSAQQGKELFKFIFGYSECIFITNLNLLDYYIHVVIPGDLYPDRKQTFSL